MDVRGNCCSVGRVNVTKQAQNAQNPSVVLCAPLVPPSWRSHADPQLIISVGVIGLVFKSVIY